MRAILVVLVLASAASAQPRKPSAAQARAWNASAYRKALAKQKLAAITLSAVPAAPDEAVDATRYIGNVVFDVGGHHDPEFVVDRRKRVFHVVRRMTTIGRVLERVCHAGPPPPIRIKRTRFDVPAGHAYAGDVEVGFGGFVLDEQNTCK